MRRKLSAVWPYLAPLPFLLALWGPALLHPLTLLPTSARGDLPWRFAPLRDFSFSWLKAGHLPLWDPLIMGGVPNLGGLEAALLYPPNWLHLALPLGLALNLLLLLHLWLGGALAALFARRLGAGSAGAALAALSWSFGGAVWPRLIAGHATMVCALAWTPLVYASVDAWLAEGSFGWLAAGGAAFGLQLLAGYPETAYQTALGALLFAALRGRGRRGAVKAWSGLAALFAAGTLAAAAQLVPAWQAARESARLTQGYAFSASFSLPPESLLTLAAPYWLGGGRAAYFGRLYFWEATVFCGAAGLLLAACCPKPARRPLWGGAALLLLLALGAHTPLHRVLYEALPGFSLFRGSSKFAAQALLLLAAAAALGYEELAAAAGRRHAARLALGGALALAAACAACALLPGPRASALSALLASPESYVAPVLRQDAGFLESASASMASSLGLAALALLLCAAALTRGRREGVAAVLAAELLLYAAAQRTTAPVRPDPPAELAAALAADPGDYRFLCHWPSQPNLGLRLGHPEAWGYDQLVTRRWAELAAWTQGRPPEGASLYQPVETLTARTSVLRARYAWAGEPPRLSRAERPELPRAFVARAVPVEEGGALAAMTRTGFDPRKEAVVEAAASVLPDPESFNGGSAAVKDLSPDELEVEADAPGGGLLVVTDAYSAGWTAQGGYRLLPADHALRGVPLSPGRHRLRLVYDPSGRRAGLILSGLGWLLLCAAGGAKLARWN